MKGAIINTQPHTFYYKIPQEAFYKATIVTALSSPVIISDILCMCVPEPGFPFEDVMLKITSAFGTIGLSTGIAPGLGPLSKLLEVLTMYIGRLKPLAIITIWVLKPDTSASSPGGSMSVG